MKRIKKGNYFIFEVKGKSGQMYQIAIAKKYEKCAIKELKKIVPQGAIIINIHTYI